MKNPWTNVYGLARSLLALSTLLTLLTNDAVSLFSPATRGIVDTDSALVRSTLFGLLHSHLEATRWIAVAILFVVVAGYRPRFTGILHWWVAWSFQMTCIPADGGDQVAAVLSLLFVPLTLSDPRRWHWDAAPTLDSKLGVVLSRVGLSAVGLARLQAAAIYFHAAVGKLAVPEWINGTAMYYWVLDPRIGFPSKYHHWIVTLLAPDWVVAILSWSPVALELALTLVLTMSSEHPFRKPLFWLGLVFHAFNILLFGLVSFFFSMSAVLVMLAWPVEQPIRFDRLRLRALGIIDRIPPAQRRTTVRTTG